MTQHPVKRPNPSSGPQPVKRGRSGPLVALVSLTTTWEVSTNRADEISFHVTTEATVNQPDVRVDIIQYHMDGFSARSGTNGLQAQLFEMTAFARDKRDAVVRSTRGTNSIATYDDYPGYEPGVGIQANTDLKYVFGAKWDIMVGNTLLVSTGPLFGIISGTYHHNSRTLIPAQAVTATWNSTQNRWDGRGSLLTAYPTWHPYPQPQVDNTAADSGDDADSGNDSDY